MRQREKIIHNGNFTNRRSLSSSSLQNFICKTRDRRRKNPTGCGSSRRPPLSGSSRHENMTETKGMKSPSKSFDVFEFKEEDMLTERTVKKIAPEFESPQTLNAESYAEETPELSHVLCNDLVSHGQATDLKDIESGNVYSNVDYGSSPDATLRVEDHSDYAFPVSSCIVKSNFLTLDAVNSMTERSPSDISNDDASSGGPSSENCFGGGDLDDEREGIVFYADYLDYGGTRYMDSVVCFSRSYVEARSRIVYGDEETFHIHIEIEDIVRIQSQWIARFEAGTIIINFIAKDPAETEFDVIHNASGLQELKFPTFDSNWYEKHEAIELLNVGYKALWNVLLDTGVDSILNEREDLMLSGSYFPKFDRPFEELIYPKGDPDAVSISKRDVDLLLPDTFVNDTIIDFYIKYLKTRQIVDTRTKFHFFNSFFFRKLADMDKDPSSAFDGKAAFQRVRKWTRKVNLLEKDFIVIPVNYNLHWSLIVICYFGEVASYKDGDGDGESGRVPCILHMDSLRGTHSGLKDLMQSYLWEEWKERQKGTCEDSLCSKFKNLKFVSLELPQQQNSYDCGLFLLHYVELFLEEVPADFSIYKITSSSKFLQEDWFPPAEPSVKRTHIEKLVSGLLDSKSEDCPPSGGNDMHCSREDLNTTNGFENDLQLTVKSGPLGDCRESPLCQVGHGIEMTLLPSTSARSTQCTSTSGLVLKELFKQVSAPESFTHAHWEALESRASIFELENTAPLTEGEVKDSECFISTELVEHAFQHPDGVTSEIPIFPFPPEDYRSDAVFRPTPEDADSTPLTSDHDSGGALLNVEESHGVDDISASNANSFFVKNYSELGHEANKPYDHDISDEVVCTPAFASADKLNVVDCERPHQMVDINDEINPHMAPSNILRSREQDNGGVEREWVSESPDEQHAAKRMRISPPIDGVEEQELNDNLSHDLNL